MDGYFPCSSKIPATPHCTQRSKPVGTIFCTGVDIKSCKVVGFDHFIKHEIQQTTWRLIDSKASHPAGLCILFHPAIPDARIWSKLGEKEEHGEYWEHGEHGKDRKHQSNDLNTLFFIRNTLLVTQNTLFGNHTAVLGDLFYKAETHSLPKNPCVTSKIHDKSLTKILQDIDVPEFSS